MVRVRVRNGIRKFFSRFKVVEGKPGEISYSVWLRATETAINPA